MTDLLTHLSHGPRNNRPRCGAAVTEGVSRTVLSLRKFETSERPCWACAAKMVNWTRGRWRMPNRRSG